jgi:hypothetical protein
MYVLSQQAQTLFEERPLGFSAAPGLALKPC